MAPVNDKSRLPPSLILKTFPHLHHDIKTIASVYLLNINSKINSRSVNPTINTQDMKTPIKTRDNITIIETWKLNLYKSRNLDKFKLGI